MQFNYEVNYYHVFKIIRFNEVLASRLENLISLKLTYQTCFLSPYYSEEGAYTFYLAHFKKKPRRKL